MWMGSAQGNSFRLSLGCCSLYAGQGVCSFHLGNASAGTRVESILWMPENTILLVHGWDTIHPPSPPSCILELITARKVSNAGVKTGGNKCKPLAPLGQVLS